MSGDNWLSLLIVLVSLLLSAFFSAGETSLTAASRARLTRMQNQGNKRAGIVLRLLETRERMIGALLLGNNVANIGASALTTSVLLAFFGDVGVIYATVVMSVVVIVFCEVLPKTAAISAPEREFRAGYAETVKYGLLGDANFFEWLDANWRDVFAGGPAREHAIAVSCRAKAAIVARDERETGDRMLLNLGHTFGHAFEAAAGFSDRLLHGEAVGLGMSLAFEFSARRGLISKDDADRVIAHLAATGLPTHVKAVAGGNWPGVDAMMDLISQDKKVKRGQLTFILVRGIGQAFVTRDVEAAEVRSFLAEKLGAR